MILTKAADHSSTPAGPIAPSKQYDGYSFRFHHTDKVLVKWPHQPNDAVIEYHKDMESYLKHLRVSYRQTRVAIFKNGNLLTTGEAICWSPDRYTKSTGRRNALLNATAKLDRGNRKAIFNAYNRMLEGQ